MITTVVNLRLEPYDVYIGRPSKWGNPFTHSKRAANRDGLIWVPTVEQAVRAYEEWILLYPQLMNQLHTLKGKRLGCFCKPGPCHGDVLARLANE